MANYYKVEKDVSLPKAHRAIYSLSGQVLGYETEGINYNAGAVVPDSEIDPRVVERIVAGDEHLNSLLSSASEQDYKDYLASINATYVRVPEHSVEAYVLASDAEGSYDLLSEDEGLVQAAAGAEDAKESQQTLKEEVGDNVPAEADDRSAVDFAAAKGEADVEAGEVLQPDEFVTGESDVPADPGSGSGDPTPAPSDGGATEAKASRRTKKPDNS